MPRQNQRSRPSLQARGRRLADEGFTGGRVEDFERLGRLQLISLLRRGLSPYHRVLDVGCGALRGGYWLIHFLEPRRYHGIEPNREMLDAGRDIVLEDGLEERKQPAFSNVDDFTFTVFDETFDFVFARSVWTHAAKRHITRMLDQFVRVAAPAGMFLTSFHPAPLGLFDYTGDEWVGLSHDSDEPGIVRHSLGWIRQQCRDRGLQVRVSPRDLVHRQVWLEITRDDAASAVADS